MLIIKSPFGISFLILLTFLLSVWIKPLNAAPKSDLLPQWASSDESNPVTISHETWQLILDKYLVKSGDQNLFRYKTVSHQDKQIIEQYIRKLSKIDPRKYRKKEQFPYWVNLYNAATINLVLDNYPTSSIRNIGSFFRFGPWDKNIVTVAGESLSLNDIEHRILRPIWRDPRIHYVVNCASLGCPNLPKQALTGMNTEFVLNKAAETFINSPKGVTIQGNELVLSSIFDWYAEDFGETEKQVLMHIDQYRKKDPVAGWQGSIDYKYDWNLNQY